MALNSDQHGSVAPKYSPDQYKNIAICIFLKEMTISETANELNIPVSTVGKRKIKIQQILKNKLKK